MSMQVSLGNNQQAVAFGSSKAERKREQAARFVNAGDKEIDRLAKFKYNKMYKADDKKFDKRINTTLNTLPVVAVASGLAAGKGAKGSLMSGLSWGLALAAPVMVGAANKALVKNNPDLAEKERKNPGVAMLGAIGASLGAYFGLAALADKVLAKPAVAKKVDSAIGAASEAIKGAAGKVTEAIGRVKVPDGVSKVVEGAKNMVPKAVKENISQVANGKFMRDAKKFTLNNAPTLLVAGIFGALIGKALSTDKKMANIKSEIKDAQFNTAKTLVNTYKAENKTLKEENEILVSLAKFPDGVEAAKDSDK